MSLLKTLPIPTLDRPFGIELWPIFSKVFEVIVGYPAEEFAFVYNTTPISTLSTSLTIITIYYIVIGSGYMFMKNRAPYKLNALFQIHNVFLTLLSGSLLALFIEQLTPMLVRHGVFYSICNSDAWNQKMVTLYYVSFLSRRSFIQGIWLKEEDK